MTTENPAEFQIDYWMTTFFIWALWTIIYLIMLFGWQIGGPRCK